MARKFWIAIAAWTACFFVTIAVSAMRAPKQDDQFGALSTGLLKSRMMLI